MSRRIASDSAEILFACLNVAIASTMLWGRVTILRTIESGFTTMEVMLVASVMLDKAHHLHHR